VLVTAGPTYEAIDPVRFIGNHSSGKQGIAIAQAFAALGAHVSLICGPVEQSLLPTHKNITTINIQSGQEMLEATLSACKTHAFHIGIFSAAVADWRIKNQSDSKIKKNSDTTTPELELEANTDILKTIASKDFKDRPEIVVGFAAETDDLVHNATMKLTSKNCDVILANAVTEKDNAFGSDENKIYCLTKENQSNVTVDEWPRATKLSVAQKLAELMIRKLNSAEHLKAAE
jgi:phosphopantothenoylcysteine decarboxylase/phosphopantothenate--cysteine ligase